MAKTKSGYLVANTTGSAEIDGQKYDFTAGETRISTSHPLAKGCPLYFDPVEDSALPEVEQATAAPGEKRGA